MRNDLRSVFCELNASECRIRGRRLLKVQVVNDGATRRSRFVCFARQLVIRLKRCNTRFLELYGVLVVTSKNISGVSEGRVTGCLWISVARGSGTSRLAVHKTVSEGFASVDLKTDLERN